MDKNLFTQFCLTGLERMYSMQRTLDRAIAYYNEGWLRRRELWLAARRNIASGSKE